MSQPAAVTSRSPLLTRLFLSLAILVAAGGSSVLLAQEPAGVTGEIDRFLEECGQHEEGQEDEGEDEESKSRFSDKCIPLADIPDRPRPIFELGEPFLGTGTLGKGFTLPTGAVWQPALMAFGRLRTATQGFGTDEDVAFSEWTNRFDLFGNLYLTQTERVLVGFRPLDQNGAFTSYTFQGDLPGETVDREFAGEFNFRATTLFFEGDLAEIFPSLDREDSAGLDVYFGVGRQPLAFQDGMLVSEDALDMIGLTRANMKIGGTVNTRIAGVFGWGEVTRHGRSGNVFDPDARVWGLFSEIDTRSSTMEIDAVYVSGGTETGSGIHGGFSDIRRIGKFNNTFRLLGSFPVGAETEFNSTGVLIHNQFGWTPAYNYNFWYVGTFLGLGQFRSAVRGPSAGGPAGATGLLFAAPGIGRVQAPLGNSVDNTVGASLGHQIFSYDTRKQLVLEVGGRYGFRDVTDDTGAVLLRPQTSIGALARFQAAMGRRFVFVTDLFGSANRTRDVVTGGVRVELQLAL